MAELQPAGERRPTTMATVISSYEARTVECPACGAKVHQRCTQPSEKSRYEVGWVHLARETAYFEAHLKL